MIKLNKLKKERWFVFEANICKVAWALVWYIYRFITDQTTIRESLVEFVQQLTLYTWKTIKKHK